MIETKNRKILMVAVVALLALASIAVIAAEHGDDTDAAATGNVSVIYGQSLNINVGQTGLSTNDQGRFGAQLIVASGSSLPPGTSLNETFTGGPGAPSTWTYQIQGNYNTMSNWSTTFVNKNTGVEIGTVNFTVSVPKITITYDGNGGLVNGSQIYTTEIIPGSFVPILTATFSNGSQTFLGWATTQTGTPITSLAPTVNTTLYAQWAQASATSSSWSGTITQGQSFSHAFTTTPTSATITISSSPVGWGASMSGNTLSGSVPAGAQPGDYYITLRIASTGFTTTTTTVTITVPVYVEPPIDKSQSVGTVLSYQPVTNPSNATVSLTSVQLGSTTLSGLGGFSVTNRTITGTLAQVGNYTFNSTVSAPGYASSSFTFRVASTPADTTTSPPTIGGITATQTPGAPRTWDFVAVNPSNYAAISWSVVGGAVFQTASTTAIYQFPTAGQYTVSCQLTGFDSSTVQATKTIMVTDSYHPDMAWAGVPYTFTVQGTPAVDLLDALWLSDSTTTVDSIQYTTISGTPTTGNIGNTYEYSVDSITTDVTVYAAQTVAPSPSFDLTLSSDGFTATANWTGQYASVVLFNYGDGSPATTSTTHTYAKAGAYTVVATGVNNVSERTASQLLSVGGFVDDKPSIYLQDLTDVTYHQGETVYIAITINPGDVVGILGAADEFLTTEGNVITGDTSGVELGDYDLTVTVTPSSGAQLSKTVPLTILAAEIPTPPTPPIDWHKIAYYIVGLLALLIVLYVLVKILKHGKRKVKGKK